MGRNILFELGRSFIRSYVGSFIPPMIMMLHPRSGPIDPNLLLDWVECDELAVHRVRSQVRYLHRRGGGWLVFSYLL